MLESSHVALPRRLIPLLVCDYFSNNCFPWIFPQKLYLFLLCITIREKNLLLSWAENNVGHFGLLKEGERTKVHQEPAVHSQLPEEGENEHLARFRNGFTSDCISDCSAVLDPVDSEKHFNARAKVSEEMWVTPDRNPIRPLISLNFSRNWSSQLRPTSHVLPHVLRPRGFAHQNGIFNRRW